MDLIRSGEIHLLINTLSTDKRIEREAASIRRASVEAGVPCLTSLDTARALRLALSATSQSDRTSVQTVDEYFPVMQQDDWGTK